MNEKYYIIFDGKSVIGTDEYAWEDNDSFQNYWWFDSSDVVETWTDADVFLTRQQVIDVLEFYTKLNGKNVYELDNLIPFDNLIPYGFVDELKKDTKKAMHRLSSIGNFTNAELIDVLNSEKNVDNSMKTDAVKRPSHYMLEDGTEVKNHIRSILGDEGFKSWAIGNAIKYVSRYKDKGNPIQDLKKAQENIQMVIDVLGEQDDLD